MMSATITGCYLMKKFPCPFCESINTSVQDVSPAFTMGQFAVVCDDCQAEGPTADKEFRAIELWNNRIDED